MATLRISRQSLDSEREVVKEERRWRYENEPFGLLSEIIYDEAFTTHPYKHTTIGSMADLEAASTEDVQEFFDTYYVPENATLTLVGDFDTDYALQMVEHYFGRACRRRRKPVPRNLPREPAPLASRRLTVEADNWPLPAVVSRTPSPTTGHPDAYPLHILSKIPVGRAERPDSPPAGLRAAGGGLGLRPGSDHRGIRTCSMRVALVQPGRTPETVAAALIAELDRVKGTA